MKPFCKSIVLFLFAFIILQPISIAQEMKDQLYIVREEVAKVDKWDQYEKTSKEWVEMMTKGDLNLPYVQASQRDDGHYYYLIPINSYADIDKLPGIFGAAVEKAGKDKWSSFMIENEGSIVTHKDFVVKWSAEFSYIPKEPKVKEQDAKFIHWLFFHFKLEKKKELLEVLKEWKKLYEDKKINAGYSIWFVELGLDNNMMVLTEFAKDGADFYSTMKENSALIKTEEDALWAKMAPLLESIDQKFGSPRPDLGYVKK